MFHYIDFAKLPSSAQSSSAEMVFIIKLRPTTHPPGESKQIYCNANLPQRKFTTKQIYCDTNLLQRKFTVKQIYFNANILHYITSLA